MALTLLENKLLNEIQKYLPVKSAGKVFYVDNSGLPKYELENAPYATITLALAQCVSNRGDVIIVRRGHAETISAAAGIAISKAGVSIIGQGRGSSRPTITFGSATTADLDIDAADVTLENLRFVANFADIVNPIDVNAVNCTIRNCEFSEGTDLNFLTCIQGATSGVSNDLLVEGCSFICPDAANLAAIAFPANHRTIIRSNWFRGDWGTSCISNTAASNDVQIYGNAFYNLQTADVSDIIDMHASSTGWIDDNQCYHGNTTAGNHTTAIDAGSCLMGVKNRIQDAFGTPPAAQYGDIVGAINTDA